MWFDALADVMWGSHCPVCGNPGTTVCSACFPPLAVRQLNVTDRLLTLVLTEKPVAACDYNSSFRFLISAIKEHGRHDLVPIIADFTQKAFSYLHDIPDGTVAVGIPSQWSVRYKRGLCLPEEIAKTLPIPRMDLLAFARSVRDQAGLRAVDRQTNMAGAFKTKPFPPQTVIVVDDICTTGATLHAAVSALVKSGHHVHTAVFAAATDI